MIAPSAVPRIKTARYSFNQMSWPLQVVELLQIIFFEFETQVLELTDFPQSFCTEVFTSRERKKAMRYNLRNC
jgi:hypothetical protein